MKGLAAAEVLDLWDRAASMIPARRALVALSAVVSADPCPTVGHRDALLLRLYASTYGPLFSAVSRCPACGEALDVDVEVAALLVDPPAHLVGSVDTAEGPVEFRLPDARDLAEVTNADDLFGRCVGREVTVATRAEIERLMEAGDPGAELGLALTCPACHHGWSDVLDPMTFLWAANTARVRQLADDIDVLGRAYGWSEADVLALSERRRRLYLEAVGR
jgi:hypothetical protein